MPKIKVPEAKKHKCQFEIQLPLEFGRTEYCGRCVHCGELKIIKTKK